jgi:5-hydroxyisourate hydrolase
VSAGLSTHVLDTASGRPAAAVGVSVFRRDGDARVPLCTASTDANGRCAALLPAGVPLAGGTYEIDFGIGAYFAASPGAALAKPFLDVVTVRFVVSEPEAHYHVPLLVSPFGYSTYRGS